MQYLYCDPGLIGSLSILIFIIWVIKYIIIDRPKETQMDNAIFKQQNGEIVYEDELSALSDKEFYEFTKQKRSKESKTLSYIVFAITYAIVLYIFH